MSRPASLFARLVRDQIRSYSDAKAVKPVKKRKRKVIDETSIAGAQHRASFSSPSFGYLIAELSATRPGMNRVEGETMSEEQRTYARRVAQWVVGVPLVFGTCVVGLNWLRKTEDTVDGLVD